MKSISDKKPSDNNGLIWAAGMGAIILLLLIINKIVKFWKYKAEGNANWALFNSRSEEMRLDQNEVEILIRMIKLTNLNHDPYSVLTLESDFRSGSEKFFEIELADDSSDQNKTEYKQKIDQLRTKLGFGPSAISGEQSSSKQIREGTSVSITVAGQEEEFSAVVQQSNAENLTLKVKSEHANPCSPGDKWLVTFINNKTLWKFETIIISKEGGLIFVTHADNMKFVDMRKFDRVLVEKEALIAKFPFHTEDNHIVSPSFAKARIVEIAGTGIRIRMPQNFRNGKKVLVVMEIELKGVVQAVGIIRNSYGSGGIHNEYGVELLGLKPTEVAELARISKQASVDNKKFNNKANWKKGFAKSA